MGKSYYVHRMKLMRHFSIHIFQLLRFLGQVVACRIIRGGYEAHVILVYMHLLLFMKVL